jgi:hypothetical protein
MCWTGRINTVTGGVDDDLVNAARKTAVFDDVSEDVADGSGTAAILNLSICTANALSLVSSDERQ